MCNNHGTFDETLEPLEPPAVCNNLNIQLVKHLMLESDGHWHGGGVFLNICSTDDHCAFMHSNCSTEYL